MSKTRTRMPSAERLMTRDPRCCSPDTPLNEAARLMWEGDCGAVPVVEDGKVVAMLTDRDVCMAAYTQNLPLSQLRVESAMSSDLFTCRPEDAVDTVQETMREHQVRRVPIVDGDGHLQGVLSLNDLALAAQELDSALPQDEVGQTLACICERRSELVSPS